MQVSGFRRRVQEVQCPPVARTRVDGPAVVAEDDCTVWIPDGWRAAPHPTGAWIITERGR